jgi:hypothetical protein
MRPLIAVVSCHSRPEFADAVRCTWLPSVPVTADVRFFLGQGANREPKQDEVFLDCRDDYEGLPDKVQSIAKWALEHDYAHMLKVDDDVILKPRDMLGSGFDQYDFVGPLNGTSKTGGIQTPYGFCYWLSRKAMECLAGSQLPEGSNDEYLVSLVLHQKGIFLHADPRYFLFMGKRTQMVQMCTTNRPLRRFVDPPAKDPIPGTFAWCIYLNWQGWHTTPRSEVIQEMKRIFMENL